MHVATANAAIGVLQFEWLTDYNHRRFTRVQPKHECCCRYGGTSADNHVLGAVRARQVMPSVCCADHVAAGTSPSLSACLWWRFCMLSHCATRLHCVTSRALRHGRSLATSRRSSSASHGRRSPNGLTSTARSTPCTYCCAWAQAPAANPYVVWSRAGPGRHAFTKPIIIITDVEAVKPILGPNHADFKKDPWTYSVFRYVIACPCTHVCSHMRTL